MKRYFLITLLAISISVAGCNSEGNVNPQLENQGPKEDIEENTEENAVDDNVDIDADVDEDTDADIDAEATTDTSVEGSEFGDISEAFDLFLKGEKDIYVGEGVHVGYNDYEGSYAGDSLSYEEIKSLVSQSVFEEAVNPKASFIKVNIKGSDCILLRFTDVGINGPTEDGSSTTFVIALRDKELIATYSVDSYARGSADIYPSGLIVDGGSAGAGDHIYNLGCIDEQGNYNSIFKSEECYVGWIGSLFEWFEDGKFSDNTVNIAKQYDLLDTYDFAITLYSMGDDILGVFPSDSGEVFEELKAAAVKDGMIAVTDDELEDYLEDRLTLAGFSLEDYENTNYEEAQEFVETFTGIED